MRSSIPRLFPRQPRPSLRLQPRRPPRPHRTYTSTPTPPPPPQPTAKASSRAERIIDRLPGPLRRYASRLRGAPLTHVAAFLILHEITALVPLVGLFGLFHYTEHVPLASYLTDNYGGYVREGARRFERYFRRKGWFGFDKEGTADTDGAGVPGSVIETEEVMASDDARYKVVVEVGLAYAVTKALLPVRIVASVWATPWFAGVLMGLRRLLGPKK